MRQPIDEMKAKIIENFERQQSAFVTSASLLDDGIIDPRDTRNVLGFAHCGLQGRRRAQRAARSIRRREAMS